ncbi:CHC2 zinc finger domain-containing protein, partial [Agathobacter rectalis]|uniref:CHC2 zinc finger domain-containing protein n=1 Tax=Agathobacter rectalis TaxID=39491 RepID=UPI0027D227F3
MGIIQNRYFPFSEGARSFGCGAGGNVFTFLMQYENFTFPEAMQELADRVGIELPKQEITSAQRREADRRTQLL